MAQHQLPSVAVATWQKSGCLPFYGQGVKLKISRKFRLWNLNNRQTQRIYLKTG